MRESGFDISFRFGPYGAATHHYAPICLNSLLYKTEKDLQEMGEVLGRKDDAKNSSDAPRKEKTGSRNISGTRHADYFLTTTSTLERVLPTSTSRLSIRCGQESQLPSRRRSWCIIWAYSNSLEAWR